MRSFYMKCEVFSFSFVLISPFWHRDLKAVKKFISWFDQHTQLLSISNFMWLYRRLSVLSDQWIFSETMSIEYLKLKYILNANILKILKIYEIDLEHYVLSRMQCEELCDIENRWNRFLDCVSGYPFFVWVFVYFSQFRRITCSIAIYTPHFSVLSDVTAKN